MWAPSVSSSSGSQAPPPHSQNTFLSFNHLHLQALPVNNDYDYDHDDAASQPPVGYALSFFFFCLTHLQFITAHLLCCLVQ